MQNIVTKIFVILLILVLCGLSIKYSHIRLGKDLRGGVSLVYQVSIPEGEDAQRILGETITNLKDRVNPTGVLDISMQPLGRDRIEVVMPLPDAEVRGLQKTYRDALTTLVAEAEIAESALDDALRRSTAPNELGGDPATERGRQVAALQAAYKARTSARAELAEARARGDEESTLTPLFLKVAEAENDFEDLYDAVLRLSLGESRVRRVLGLSRDPQKVTAVDGSLRRDEAGQPILGPSPRDESLEVLKNDFPHVKEELVATVEAFDAYQAKRKGLDDPEDLVRLMRGAGVLEFRIAVTNTQSDGVDIPEMRRQLAEAGPENTTSPLARWFHINKLEQWFDGPEEEAFLNADPEAFFGQPGRGDLVAGVSEDEIYLLLFTAPNKSITHDAGRKWSVANAFSTPDQLGRPAVSFELDSVGGGRMGKLTGGNINRPMAIVLDSEVFSAPSIRSQINNQGQITGSFSQAEIAYLVRVLNAGSLSARLSPDPIAVNTLGPSIGQDNLNRGREAFIISVIAVAVFMLIYYLFAGIVANIALLANGIIIFGVMMAIDGTFTLPGLAGIVLTIGMAVDANVLIYERIREEIFADELDLRGAIRQGYRKALSTILDANITNLIVCFVLFKTATTEVKGFALTLTIGICATLFTALFVTRQIFYLYTDLFKARKLPMLPTIFPAIHRTLEPNINWLGMRKIFWTFSVIAVVASLLLVSQRGVDMFDTEFRGGVSLTMSTAAVDANGDGKPDLNEQGDVSRRRFSQAEVEERIRALSAQAADITDIETASIFNEMSNAVVLTAGETVVDAETGQIMAESFQVKVASPKGMSENKTIATTIVDAIVREFGEDLDVRQPLDFLGAGDADQSGRVFPITNEELGANINEPAATQRIPEFRGGAAIVLRNVTPLSTSEEIADRIENMRNQPDFSRYSGRKVQVLGLTPADGGGYRDHVVLIFDPNYSYLKLTNPQVWYSEMAQAEWNLIGTALQRPTSLEQVSEFSSAVADTQTATAIVAVVLTLLGILVYIWVRFGSLRYSLAAIVALAHDVTIALGLLALTGLIGDTALGKALLLEPFRINLGVVAALLTIIGYSLNDTIVILDRIRENRGKLPLPTAPIVNRSINQTVSRTLLTSVTTLLAVGIMYVEGGSGIRSFAFCLLVGLIVGTYSSVAIAAPLVFTGRADAGTKSREEEGTAMELPTAAA